MVGVEQYVMPRVKFLSCVGSWHVVWIGGGAHKILLHWFRLIAFELLVH